MSKFKQNSGDNFAPGKNNAPKVERVSESVAMELRATLSSTGTSLAMMYDRVNRISNEYHSNPVTMTEPNPVGVVGTQAAVADVVWSAPATQEPQPQPTPKFDAAPKWVETPNQPAAEQYPATPVANQQPSYKFDVPQQPVVEQFTNPIADQPVDPKQAFIENARRLVEEARANA